MYESFCNCIQCHHYYPCSDNVLDADQEARPRSRHRGAVVAARCERESGGERATGDAERPKHRLSLRALGKVEVIGGMAPPQRLRLAPPLAVSSRDRDMRVLRSEIQDVVKEVEKVKNRLDEIISVLREILAQGESTRGS